MEVQTWPAFINAPQTQAPAARSRSASLRTIIGSLPPSSNDTGIKPLRGAAHDAFAGLDAAGKGDHIGVVDKRFAGIAVADDDLQQVLGKAGPVRQVGAEERRQRRQLGRLDDDGVARHERGNGLARASAPEESSTG